MTQNNNRQAPMNPDLMKALMASNQPKPPIGGFQHIHGSPSPCPAVQGVSFPFGDKVAFYTTGGLTTFEEACLKMAAAMVGTVGIYDIPGNAVNVVKETLDRCRETIDPYQGATKPDPFAEDKPPCAE